MKTCVLFVDDEPKILQGLRRMLRNMRDEWEMLFASGGSEALELIGRSRVDVVVSDMRMPEMDGAQLLAEVKKRHPHTVRFVLSGQTDQESAFRLVGSSHQFLTKPCDTHILVGSIRRALALRDLLADEKLQSLVSSLRTLPSPPDVYYELVRELRSPTSSMRTIGEIISRDVALTAKILQLSNSAFFGIGRKVLTAFQAVSLLGTERISALVLSHGIASQFEGGRVGRASLVRLQAHSFACGGLAQAIAQAEKLDQRAVEHAFVAGMLHDVGTLVLAANRHCDYEKVIGASQREDAERLDAERRQLGATHAEVGAYLAGLWGLPNAVVETIAYHHRPRDCLSQTVDVLTAVHVAEGLTQDSPRNGDDRVLADCLDHDYLARRGVINRLPAWRKIYLGLAGKARSQ